MLCGDMFFCIFVDCSMKKLLNNSAISLGLLMDEPLFVILEIGSSDFLQLFIICQDVLDLFLEFMIKWLF